jgi:hypothetical protein
VEDTRTWRLLYLAAGNGHLQDVVDAVAAWTSVPACITWPSPFTGLQVYASRDASPTWVLGQDPHAQPVARYPLVRRDPRVPHAPRPQLTLFGPPHWTSGDATLLPKLLEVLGCRWRRQLEDVEVTVARAFDRVGQALAARTVDHWSELFSPLLQVATQLFLAPVAYIAVPNETGDAIAVVDKIGIRDPDFGFVLPLGRGVGGHVAARGRGVVLRDYRTTSLRDRTVSGLIDREDLRSGVIVPWTTPEGTRGALYVAWRETGRPTRWALYALSAFARRIGPWVWPHRPRLREHRLWRIGDPQHRTVGLMRSSLVEARTIGQVAAACRAAGVGLKVTDAWGTTLLKIPGTGNRETFLVSTGSARPYTVDVHWPDGWTEARDGVRQDLEQSLCPLLRADEARRVAALRERGRPESVRVPGGFLLGVSLRKPEDLQLAGLLTRNAERTGLPLKAEGLADGILYASSVPPADSFPDRLRTWVLSLPEPVLVAATTAPVPAAQQSAAWDRVRRALAAGGNGIRWIGRPTLAAWLDWSTAREALSLFAEEWMGADALGRPEWLETAYQYLLTGDIAETARRLYLHPNTVRYRLQQLRNRWGDAAWDTDAGRLALLLALAVRRATSTGL